MDLHQSCPQVMVATICGESGSFLMPFIAVSRILSETTAFPWFFFVAPPGFTPVLPKARETTISVFCVDQSIAKLLGEQLHIQLQKTVLECSNMEKKQNDKSLLRKASLYHSVATDDCLDIEVIYIVARACRGLDCILPLGSSIRPYQVHQECHSQDDNPHVVGQICSKHWPGGDYNRPGTFHFFPKKLTLWWLLDYQGLLLMPAAFFIMTLFAAIRKDRVLTDSPWNRVCHLEGLKWLGSPRFFTIYIGHLEGVPKRVRITRQDCLGVLAPWVRKKWVAFLSFFSHQTTCRC